MIRGRIGGFWWNSFLLFLSARVSDVANLAVSLWLVPKYLPNEDLGAVLPLMTFATIFAMPAYVFSFTFVRHVNKLTLTDERGKIATLVRTTFIGVSVLIVLALMLCMLALPWFIRRMNVSGGFLAFAVMFAGFLGCVAPIFLDVLQALKRFGAMSFISGAAGPVRFIAMTLALPCLALPGFFVGQSAAPLFTILFAVVFVRKELSYGAEPYWNRKTALSFVRYTFLAGLYLMIPMISSMSETSLIRICLPVDDSASYYVMSRMANVTGYLGLPVLLALFPYASEAGCRNDGKGLYGIVMRSIAFSAVVALALVVVYVFFGERIFRLLPGGEHRMFSSLELVLLTVNAALVFISSCYGNAKAAADRFGFLSWWVPIHLVYALALFLFCETFAVTMPLLVFIAAMLGFNLVKVIIIACEVIIASCGAPDLVRNRGQAK